MFYLRISSKIGLQLPTRTKLVKPLVTELLDLVWYPSDENQCLFPDIYITNVKSFVDIE